MLLVLGGTVLVLRAKEKVTNAGAALSADRTAR
jgi:hypothetical protein